MYTILVLYTELMPYNVIVLKTLVEKGCRVHVVLWDKNKKTSYYPPEEKALPGMIVLPFLILTIFIFL